MDIEELQTFVEVAYAGGISPTTLLRSLRTPLARSVPLQRRFGS